MKISQDLICVNKNNLFLIYNYEFHKALIINDNTFNSLFENKELTPKTNIDLSYLTEKEMESLISHGVIINSQEEYCLKKYENILNNRDNSVDINTVYFHLTQRCNLKCSYCYNKSNLNRADCLKTDDAKKIILELHSINVKNIIFTGGEILLRKDIVEICKYTSNLGIKCEILSNGVFLNKKPELLKYVNKFIISLDTLEPKHNLRTGLDIELLLNNLKEIPQEFKNKFTVRSVSSIPYENDWREVKEFVVEKLGMSHILVPFLPNNMSDLEYVPDLNCFPIDSEDCNLSSGICGASYKIIAIDSNGDVYPCQCLIKDKFYLSNISKPDWLEQLKNSILTQKFQNRTVLNIKDCKDCSIRYLCGGGCSAIADNLYKDINENIEILCGFQKRIAYGKLENLLVQYG